MGNKSISADGNLVFWVIYRHPRDYPDKWVLRGQEITKAGVKAQQGCFVADTLEEVRAQVPLGNTRLARHPDDEPAIYEVWL
jgi:hypothetical protein